MLPKKLNSIIRPLLHGWGKQIQIKFLNSTCKASQETRVKQLIIKIYFKDLYLLPKISNWKLKKK